MNELCLANLTLGDTGPLEFTDAAAAAGFDSINLWLAPPPAMARFARRPRNPQTLVGNAPLLRAVRERIDAGGLSVFAASCGWVSARFDPATIPGVLDAVRTLGGRSIAIVGWDDEPARLAQHVGMIAAAAQAESIDVNVEFMPYSAVRTVQDALALVAPLPANVKIIVDALHLARSGGTPAEVAAIAPERIGSLQLCDAGGAAPPPGRLRDESVNDRRLPGDGDLPLRALLAVLPAGVVIEVEAPVHASATLPASERARRCAERTRAFLGAR